MKSIFTFTLFIICLLPVNAQTKIKSGLILEGGAGYLLNTKPSPAYQLQQEDIYKKDYAVDYKKNVALGYKIRVDPVKKRFFYDLDLSLGIKEIVFDHYTYYEDGSGQPSSSYGITSDDGVRFYASLNPNFNYKIVRGFSAGMGFAPTYYLATESLVRFDVPVTLKLSYDWKCLGLAINYKHGMTNVLKTEKFASGKISDWQVQLYIPF